MSRIPNADEAAAVAAAIARFEAETAPTGGGADQAPSPWQRVALIEGVGAKPTGQDPKGGAKWLS
jgi:hypothetical protein